MSKVITFRQVLKKKQEVEYTLISKEKLIIRLELLCLKEIKDKISLKWIKFINSQRVWGRMKMHLKLHSQMQQI